MCGPNVTFAIDGDLLEEVLLVQPLTILVDCPTVAIERGDTIGGSNPNFAVGRNCYIFDQINALACPQFFRVIVFPTGSVIVAHALIVSDPYAALAIAGHAFWTAPRSI